MFPKLLAVVLAATATAAALLVARHERIEAAHRMAAVRQLMIERRAALWALERQIAERCAPAAVRALVNDGTRSSHAQEGDKAWIAIVRPDDPRPDDRGPVPRVAPAPSGSIAARVPGEARRDG